MSKPMSDFRLVELKDICERLLDDRVSDSMLSDLADHIADACLKLLAERDALKAVVLNIKDVIRAKNEPDLEDAWDSVQEAMAKLDGVGE